MASPLLHVSRALERFGPDRCDPVDEASAVAWCRTLAYGHYENFSVLSGLVPRARRDDFAAIYAFCRWADDLADETGSATAAGGRAADRERALELLAWWRRELDACFAGEARHPVFVALRPTVRRHDLPRELFDRLIRAFERDQRIARYATWADLLDYCRDSADPVGRLVLMTLGEPREERLFALSDRICTALQLTNHWQDLRRDAAERDRIYVPAELNPVARFDQRLAETVRIGHSCDATFFAESRDLVRALVERTWPLYEEGAPLVERVSPESRGLIWLFLAGGVRTLRQIELWNCETALHRPVLSKATKALLVAKARWVDFRARRSTARAATAAARAVSAESSA